MSSKIDVLKTFFEEVWSNEDTGFIKQLFVPEDIDSKAAAGLRKEENLSPDDFEIFQMSLLKLVKNMVITIDHYIEDGDWLAVRCTVNAENRNTEQSVKMLGSGWCRITDGKIREAHNFFDFLHLFEGLGLLPENTMQNCMTGSKIES